MAYSAQLNFQYNLQQKMKDIDVIKELGRFQRYTSKLKEGIGVRVENAKRAGVRKEQGVIGEMAELSISEAAKYLARFNSLGPTTKSIEQGLDQLGKNYVVVPGQTVPPQIVQEIPRILDTAHMEDKNFATEKKVLHERYLDIESQTEGDWRVSINPSNVNRVRCRNTTSRAKE